jgi:hypothetical protein
MHILQDKVTHVRSVGGAITRRDPTLKHAIYMIGCWLTSK